MDKLGIHRGRHLLGLFFLIGIFRGIGIRNTDHQVFGIFQETHMADIRLDQRVLSVLIAEVVALRHQDTRTQLLVGIYLTILVERHQLIHTVDAQLYIDLITEVAMNHLWVHLMYIIVFGYEL